MAFECIYQTFLNFKKITDEIVIRLAIIIYLANLLLIWIWRYDISERKYIFETVDKTKAKDKTGISKRYFWQTLHIHTHTPSSFELYLRIIRTEPLALQSRILIHRYQIMTTIKYTLQTGRRNDFIDLLYV